VTERTFGSNFKWFVAKVVNRGDGKSGEKDKTESGRVQIRIYGKHDDEKNIPDSTLPWAVPMMPINAGAGRGGVSGTPAGLLKDSQVVGFYADEDENIPIIMGVLLRSGKDADQSPDGAGEGVTSENNDAPKGSRTSATQGSDKNDVLPTNNSLVSDVSSVNQLHNSIPTMGNLPFDGKSVLDTINKADPTNLSGSIPGALAGMKSMTGTLNVASSLLSNFSAIASGKLNLNSLLQLGAAAAGLKTYNIASAAANVAKLGTSSLALTAAAGSAFKATGITNPLQIASSVANLTTGNIAKSLVGAAFGGGNPMEAIIGGLGGVSGLTSLAGKATTMLGPISGNFGAASAIAGTLKGAGGSVMSGLKSAPIPIPFGVPKLQLPTMNLGNIAGVLPSIGVGSIAAAALQNTPLQSLGFPSPFGLNIPTASLLNSTISIPSSLSPLAIAAVASKNPAVSIAASTLLSPAISQSTSYTAYNSQVIPNVEFISPTYYSSSGLNNSSITVSIPEGLTSYSIQRTLNKNPGVNYDVHGSVFKVNKTTRTVRKK
jgi:hypothetical protein